MKGQQTLVVLYSSELENTVEKVKNAGGQIIQDIFSFPGGRRFEAFPRGAWERAMNMRFGLSRWLAGI